MKSLIIIASLNPDSIGGVEKLIRDWIKRIDLSKTKVYCFIEDTDCMETRLKSSPVVELLRFDQTLDSHKKLFSVLKRIRKGSTGCVCFFHRHFYRVSLVTMAMLHYFCRGNVFGMLHGIESIYDYAQIPSVKAGRIQWNIVSWKLKRRLGFFLKSIFVKHLFAVSEDTRSFYSRNYYFARKKPELLYHGVDPREMAFDGAARVALRDQLGIPHDALVYVTLARFSWEKRIDRVIGAFIRAFGTRQSGSSGHARYLLVVGDGQRREKLETQSKPYGNVLFLGCRSDVPAVLSAADFYVNGSDMEGFSVALLEACSVGLIPVCVHVSGTDNLWDAIDLPLGRCAQNVFALSRLIKEAVTVGDRAGWRKKIHRQVADTFNVNKSVPVLMKKIGIDAALPVECTGI